MKNLFLIGLVAFVFSSCSKENEIKETQPVDPSTGKIETVRKTTALVNYYVNGTSGNYANAGTSTATVFNAGLPGYTLQTGEVDIDKAARIVNSRVDISADESVY